MIAELLVIIIIVIALIAVGFVSYNLLKGEITDKASITTLNSIVTDANKNDSALRDKQIEFEKEFQTDKTGFNNMFQTVNSNLDINKKQLDVMNASIIDLKGGFSNNVKTLTDYDLKHSNYNSNLDVTIQNIKDTQVTKAYLSTDFANVVDNNFTIAPKKEYKNVSISGKPLSLDSMIMTNWTMAPENDRLCFANKNVKVMCLNSIPNSIELYKSDGSIGQIVKNPDTVTTTTTSTLLPATTTNPLTSTILPQVPVKTTGVNL